MIWRLSFRQNISPIKKRSSINWKQSHDDKITYLVCDGRQNVKCLEEIDEKLILYWFWWKITYHFLLLNSKLEIKYKSCNFVHLKKSRYLLTLNSSIERKSYDLFSCADMVYAVQKQPTSEIASLIAALLMINQIWFDLKPCPSTVE